MRSDSRHFSIPNALPPGCLEVVTTSRADAIGNTQFGIGSKSLTPSRVMQGEYKVEYTMGYTDYNVIATSCNAQGSLIEPPHYSSFRPTLQTYSSNDQAVLPAYGIHPHNFILIPFAINSFCITLCRGTKPLRAGREVAKYKKSRQYCRLFFLSGSPAIWLPSLKATCRM